jgi:rod shape-determining protein MreC
VVLSVVILTVDYRYHSPEVTFVRNYLSIAAYPIQWIADSPTRLLGFFDDYIFTQQGLVKENQQLKETQFLQNARIQKYQALEAENNRLRTLLQSSARTNETLAVAEIIKINADLFLHRVILNKGSEQGIHLGQAVIDAEGVVGEVIEVYPTTSRVILLTDASYGIPVENVRTGVRGVVVGTGSLKNLELKHVAHTLDLAVGDSLVTSGLDGHYPSGYPVGTVTHIVHDPGETFVAVQVEPKARLDRVREVLLLAPQKVEGE